MKYKALRDGYIGGHYVYAGETFTYNGKKPSWAECLAPEKAKIAVPAEQKVQDAGSTEQKAQNDEPENRETEPNE